MNFAKFLRPPILQNTSGRLLLNLAVRSFSHIYSWFKGSELFVNVHVPRTLHVTCVTEVEKVSLFEEKTLDISEES